MNVNEYLMSQRDIKCFEVMHDTAFPLAKRIYCVDGFSLSVQATHAAYCSPRTNVGPWYEVEVGFPSEKPDGIMGYCESPESPTDTVYGYVPVELVDALIQQHGGMKIQDPEEAA